MKVSEWAEKILNILGGSGPRAEGSLEARLRGFLPGFGKHRPFIEEFAKASNVISAILKITKQHGINQSSYRRCRDILETLPPRSKVRKKLSKWLSKHLRIQSRLGIGQMSLPVSSDIIESLMGKFKVIIQRNPKAEFNRMVLAFPTLCGVIDETQVALALSQVSHRDLKQWEAVNVVDSQAKRRKEFLPQKSHRRGPKTVRALSCKAA